MAATLVTWFTFLPSFIFILAGGPLVESTHGDHRFTAPLTADHGSRCRSDSESGAILWLLRPRPKGFEGTFDWVSALIAIRN